MARQQGGPRAAPGDQEGIFIFEDVRHCREASDLLENPQPAQAVIVTDQRALAAHEYWHRRTRGIWAKCREEASAGGGFSGKLVYLRSSDTSTFLTIVFANRLIETTVDFTVETCPGAFAVRVLAERRRPLKTLDEMCTCVSTKTLSPKLKNVALQISGEECTGSAFFDMKKVSTAVMNEEDLSLWKASQESVAGTRQAAGAVRLVELIDGAGTSMAGRAARAAFRQR
mmetsp:Transcript_66975/g.199228  ORF Transcript_66975/g.199228 Transcript_66975/m.199228 type:complete len:228 (+) Transcript_66975:55-738(+)